MVDLSTGVANGELPDTAPETPSVAFARAQARWHKKREIS
jgi:hypothetical protein